MATAVDFFFSFRSYSDKHENNLDLVYVLFFIPLTFIESDR